MPRLSANSCSQVSTVFSVTTGAFATHFCDCVLNHLLVRHIALVADQEFIHALCSVAVDLLQPLLDVVEAVHVRDIVDDADAVSAAIVRRCDGAEAFLAGSIPLSYN